MAMRSWYTPQELVGLPGLPGTARNIRNFADRKHWEGQRRLGSKAIEYAFAVLPEETQAAILKAAVTAQPVDEEPQKEQPQKKKRDAISASRMRDVQREVMTARLAFVREIERMSGAVTQQRAIMTLVGLARDGQLTPYMTEQAIKANNRKTADRTLSERTLKRWLSEYRTHGEIGLAPVLIQKDMEAPAWTTDFLRCYQRPTKPSVESAYSEFAGKYQGDRPSIHAVRRFLKKLSPEARENGRRCPQELKALQPFKRRTTKNLFPGDVYTADGHKFDAEVINPHTGKPYRPEITTVIDVATRRVLGVAIGEAENSIDVTFALRDAITRGGMFAYFYVDNGSGFANDMVREIVDRLGGTMTHALPYNSQARGLIERSHQSLWVRAAKKLVSFIGADMDKHAGTKVHRISRQQLRDTGTTKLLPTHAEFMGAAEIEIEEYNNRPHKGLAKIRDKLTGRQRYQSPNEAWEAARAGGWEPMAAPAELVADLMRPQIERKTSRGEIAWNGNRYFLDALRGLHGETVRVAYDVRDSSRVWVRTADGELIGEALLDGNATDYLPLSRVEEAREKRARGQIKRGIDKLETLTGTRVEMIAPTTAPSANLEPAQLENAQRYAQRVIAEQASVFEIPGDPMARYRLWQVLDTRNNTGEKLTDDETRWHANYTKHQDFKSIQSMFDFADEQARA
jgi:putative transposase